MAYVSEIWDGIVRKPKKWNKQKKISFACFNFCFSLYAFVKQIWCLRVCIFYFKISNFCYKVLQSVQIFRTRTAYHLLYLTTSIYNPYAHTFLNSPRLLLWKVVYVLVKAYHSWLAVEVKLSTNVCIGLSNMR